MTALTTKQKLFIDGYLIHGNATRAAVDAGYSEKTAKVIGHENLTKPYIAEIIKKRLDERSMASGEVLDRIAEIARTDMDDFIDVKSSSLPMFDFEKAAAAGKLHLIKSFKVTRQGVEVKFYDKLKALELMAKHHALLTDRVEEHLFTWEDRAIDDIRAGNIRYEDLVREFDTDLATNLFKRAGVPVPPR